MIHPRASHTLSPTPPLQPQERRGAAAGVLLDRLPAGHGDGGGPGAALRAPLAPSPPPRHHAAAAGARSVTAGLVAAHSLCTVAAGTHAACRGLASKLSLTSARMLPLVQTAGLPAPPPRCACRACSGMCTAPRRRWWCWALAATVPSCRPSSSAAQVGPGAGCAAPCVCARLLCLLCSSTLPTLLLQPRRRSTRPAGVLRLPLLDLTPPWGSPIRPGVAAAISTALDGFSAARDQPPRLVGPDTCWVAVLYGRVFCCHHDRRAGVLRLYRLFRSARVARSGGGADAGRAGGAEVRVLPLAGHAAPCPAACTAGTWGHAVHAALLLHMSTSDGS